MLNNQNTPAWVETLRSHFPVTEKMAYFDSAYETGGSDLVWKNSKQYFTDKADIYPGIIKAGGSGKGRTVDVIQDTREKLADFLHAENWKTIAFSANTCQAIGLVLQSFPFRPGDNLVVGDLEHVSVLMPCLGMKNKGVVCRLAHSEDGLHITADELLACADDHTKMIVVSYVQSAGGYRIDMEHLTEECHKRGIFVVTDAIQALGFQQVDVQKLGVDALAASGYKGMLAIEGCGFLYCAPRLLEKLQPALVGPNPAWTIDRSTGEVTCKDLLDARKLEAGTLPFHSIYGLQAGLELLQEVGIQQIEKHISNCFEHIYRELEQIGYRLDTPFEPEHRCHSMLIRTEDQEGMLKYFEQNGIFVSAGHGIHIRISIAAFTNEDDIEKLLKTAKTYLEKTAENGR